MNEGSSRVVMPGGGGTGSSTRSAITASTTAAGADPFACTCHLIAAAQQQQQQQQAAQQLRSSMESSGTDSSQSYHAQQVLQHPHYTRFHRPLPGMGKMLTADDIYRRHQQYLAERMSQAGSDSSGILPDCHGADGVCCSCEWISKALLCSCQLPSSSDEAGSPSHPTMPSQPGMGSGGGQTGNGGTGSNGGAAKESRWGGAKGEEDQGKKVDGTHLSK